MLYVVLGLFFNIKHFWFFIRVKFPVSFSLAAIEACNFEACERKSLISRINFKKTKCVKFICARNYFEFRMRMIYSNLGVWVCRLFDDSHLLISLKYDKWLVRFCFHFMLWSYISMFKLALSRFWSFIRWRPIVNSRAFTALITEFPVWRCTRSQTFVPRFHTLS